jgi:hypothetical protein
VNIKQNKNKMEKVIFEYNEKGIKSESTCPYEPIDKIMRETVRAFYRGIMSLPEEQIEKFRGKLEIIVE